MTAVGPDWRTKHETTVKELVASLTKFGHQQIGNLLKFEKIDRNTIELTTKVDTRFKPMSETYKYQNLLARLTDLERVDEVAAIHCSEQHTHDLPVYEQDFQILTDKLRTATTIAQESRELAATTTPFLTEHTSNHPSTSTTDTNVTNLQASVMDLTLKLTILSRKVHRLEDTPSSSPIHAVTASTSRYRNSQTSKSSILTASTKDTRHKHKHDTNMTPTLAEVPCGIKITYVTPSKDPLLTLNHGPPLSKHGNLQIMTRPSNTSDILHWSDKSISSRERPSVRYCNVLPKSLLPWPKIILTMRSSQRNGMTTAKISYVTLTHISRLTLPLPKP